MTGREDREAVAARRLRARIEELKHAASKAAEKRQRAEGFPVLPGGWRKEHRERAEAILAEELGKRQGQMDQLGRKLARLEGSA